MVFPYSEITMSPYTHTHTHKFSDFRVNQLEVFEKAECEVSFLLLCPSKTSLLKYGTISSETRFSMQHNRNEKKSCCEDKKKNPQKTPNVSKNKMER